jgi:O-antigen/teichoic acid export membrane protein
MFAAPVLVSSIFGERYEDAVPLVRILAIALPIRYVLYSMAAAFYSRQHILRKVTFGGIAAAATIALTFVLAPLLGLTGAAVSVVFGDSLLLLLYSWGAYRYIEGITPWSSLRPSILRESLQYVWGSRAGLR